MMAEGRYIYCIIGETKDYNPPTTLPSEARAPKNFGYIGINNQEVSLVHYKDIAAVVSPTPVINFDRLDKKELMRHITVHQKVNEEMMSAKACLLPAQAGRRQGGSASPASPSEAGRAGGKYYDVCPMTFGIIAPRVDEVRRILEKAYLQFKTALKNVIGKAEFVVQVWWNPQKILEELANTNLEIQKLTHSTSLRVASTELSRMSNPEPVEGLKQELSSKGTILGMPINPVRDKTPKASVQFSADPVRNFISNGAEISNGVKLKLGKLIQKEAEIQREAFVNDIQQILGSISHGFTSNKLIDDACPVGSQKLSFGEMIANFSFLVEKTRESELDRKMQELGKKYEGKLRFKYIGPMPPYSFVNINLGLGNFELINEARKLLGLAEKVTFDEIKNAYYALSHQYHPDKYGGEPKTAEKMKKITKAYRVLENYCQSCDNTRTNAEDYMEQRGSQKYSFKKEDVKNSLIIK